MGPIYTNNSFYTHEVSYRRISTGSYNRWSNSISWSTSSNGAWIKFEQAVACCFIASILITSGPIIFGEPLAPGWVTPALPLVIAFFISKGYFDGVYRKKLFIMAAMCIEFTIIILFLGLTGLGRVIVEKFLML